MIFSPSQGHSLDMSMLLFYLELTLVGLRQLLSKQQATLVCPEVINGIFHNQSMYIIKERVINLKVILSGK